MGQSRSYGGFQGEANLDKIAVLIPCYNEEKTVEKVVRDFRQVLPEAVIYVYDNNSSDRTVELAEKAGAVVRHEYLQGKGNVIRRMFREIDAEVYIMTDGDDTYPAEFAREMVDKVLHSLVRGTINKLFHTEIKDIMTGYRAFSYQFVKTFPVLSKGFEIETEMTIHAADKNMQVDNVVIEYRDRPEGSESKLNTFSDGAKVLMSIAKLYRNYKPMHFFGIMALLLTIISAGFFCPVLAEYVATGLVPKFPTLIVCGFTLMAAIQSVFAGLILAAGAQRSRQEFEMHLMQVDIRYKELKKDE